MKSLLASIESRGKPVTDIEEGYISTSCCVLANLSRKRHASRAPPRLSREVAIARELEDVEASIRWTKTFLALPSRDQGRFLAKRAVSIGLDAIFY
jgi:hypothetical protein